MSDGVYLNHKEGQVGNQVIKMIGILTIGILIGVTIGSAIWRKTL